MDDLPAPWPGIVNLLLAAKKRGSLDEDCVICSRPTSDNADFMPLKHPTRKCGFLWTLTKKGLEWLRKRYTKDSTAQNLAEASGYTEEELGATICQVCCGTDLEENLSFLQAAAAAEWADPFNEIPLTMAGQCLLDTEEALS
jgi:hypothetical protein